MDNSNRNTNSGLASFIAATGTIGNVILGATVHKNSFEPLPFTDNSLFDDNYDTTLLSIHINPQSNSKHIYLPNTPINVSIEGERKHGPHFLHPYNYKLSFEHGKYKWDVWRSYKDIKDTHKALEKIVKADLGQSCSDISKEDIKPDWPMFPTEHDHLILQENINERCKNLAEYLRRALTYPPYRNHPSMISLVCVSPLSFVHDLGNSLIEGVVNKRLGDNIFYGRCSKLRICCERAKVFHTKRWFVVKDSYVAYANPDKNYEIGFVMLVDTNFNINKGVRANAVYSIRIKNLQRSLVLKFKNQAQQLEWYNRLDDLLQNEAKLFHAPGRFNSYAPIRADQKCRWYVNAAGYMEAILSGLHAAKEEIFITDWWLCPEIFLKRPTDDLQYRLDKILLKKAKEGVKVYILLFKEVELALGLKSLRAKRVLTQAGKNPNIKVLRHPEHTPAGVFLWSHHEKCVIIDQTVAFLGGIDLCFGRWDDDLHRIIDLGKKENDTELIRPTVEDEAAAASAPAAGDANPAINTANALLVSALMGGFSSKSLGSGGGGVGVGSIMANLTSDTKHRSTNERATSSNDINIDELPVQSSGENINKSISQSLGATNRYHKSSKYTMVPKSDNSDNGPPVLRELSNKKRVLRKWSRIKKSVIEKNKKIRRRLDSGSSSDDEERDSAEEDNAIDKTAEMPVISNEGYYWVGKDYSNCYKEDFKNIEEFSKDQFNRCEVPRMPWRDEALVVIGEAARDLARHFIQRWNQCKREKVNKNLDYPYLLPKTYQEPIAYNLDWFKEQLYTCDVQLTRSLDIWSGGICHCESSILESYVKLIEQAEHFIYIENQFFVTTADPQHDPEVKNLVGKALVERIKRAHDEQKKFRVYVVLPLLPGFDSQNAIQAVQYYNLRSINIGEYSLYSALKKCGIDDPSEYITFYGMRNWAVLMKHLVNEIIYVHSKLLIVDDKHVICGSANINDRSLLGKRDSEIAAVISDKEFTNGRFNNVKVQVGKYASSLRHKIFKLHLGIYFNNPNRIDVSDCTSDEFYELFRETSRRNTECYDDVFNSIPSDRILTFNDLKSHLTRPCLNSIDPYKAKIKLDNEVKGFIVDFPLKFLSAEKSFFPQLHTAEGLAPTEMWT